jgi:hypothetical protein
MEPRHSIHPIARWELAVVLALELEHLTERQACEQMGHGSNIVAFRYRRQYIVEQMAFVSPKSGKVPNLERETPPAYRVSD